MFKRWIISGLALQGLILPLYGSEPEKPPLYSGYIPLTPPVSLQKPPGAENAYRGYLVQPETGKSLPVTLQPQNSGNQTILRGWVGDQPIILELPAEPKFLPKGDKP